MYPMFDDNTRSSPTSMSQDAGLGWSWLEAARLVAGCSPHTLPVVAQAALASLPSLGSGGEAGPGASRVELLRSKVGQYNTFNTLHYNTLQCQCPV